LFTFASQKTKSSFYTMISRRSVRVKAMQAIYASQKNFEFIQVGDSIKNVTQSIQDASVLTTSYFHLANQICEYALIDANFRSKKHLPTPEDLSVNTRISQSLIVTDLLENASFKKEINSNPILVKMHDADIIKSLYNAFVATPEYAQFVLDQQSEKADKKVYLSVLKFLFEHEDANSYLHDYFINYEDDKKLVEDYIVRNYASAKKIDFSALTDAERMQFGKELVQTYCDKYDIVHEMIEPNLQNWESDRVAGLDMILLHLGLSEILYFSSIPVKVSINEYIDLAKEFSTLQSGKFVNGVLDKLQKTLTAENKIHKLEN
jgi:transcription antitermination protein NusB